MTLNRSYTKERHDISHVPEFEEGQEIRVSKPDVTLSRIIARHLAEPLVVESSTPQVCLFAIYDAVVNMGDLVSTL